MFKANALLLTIALSLGVFAPAPTFNDVFERALPSVVSVTHPSLTNPNEDTICTGFVINTARGWVLTAKHCIEGEQLFVNHIPSQLVKKVDMFAIVLIPPMTKPNLTLRTTPATRFEPLVAMGYGYGILTGLLRPVAAFNKDDLGVDGGIASGMSGGPILDMQGQVVGMIQGTFPAIGVICGADELRAFLDWKP